MSTQPLPAETALRIAAIKQSAQTRPHGTRARYLGGCKCLPCRSANSTYSSSRELARKNGDKRDLVPASEARKHILALSKQGVGYKSVADAAQVARSVVSKIRSGERRQIRLNNANSILAVDANAAAGGALISAEPTWKLIDELLARGFSKRQLATWIGWKSRTLQINKHMTTAATAAKVRRMYELLKAGKLRRG